jgi:hypothetical protein
MYGQGIEQLNWLNCSGEVAVFKAHRFVYQSTLDSRVMKKKKVGVRG